ncbi:MAG: 23S rRNA (guanosine(2251)-2'-O)-methyltransferase RlmB [Candidatus Phytoplasma stylosanthis]|uniref:23S rRNA (guanosine(2251)-2'-O)-methyltransferase RlmB n=1 Tax=Candidatus Phytoplasma stylosanthis TaxID=2798314 RepID=UPI00293A824C|nr:23S rRNA (guanosine(2251)-2'-O)-methyltransferase RlmB [Candidatus Phytoplasma stylosanthis]MDV3167784.1 23S rRNA (guanosine(2251)-2'-O)-methyltransferase RlmB [Candidatus Phytoplasma stylosanthis]MDV3170939.1 23S rRNA (guanosine(2251)-2'-O)-methyltransferase RlmB [Candidatus Phytoplasma stylosanthis]MDV3173689.1 23S rRNA (guanosine(2251)-2'-O)-methyltransferase RlmB [Candidatus Phytoplasma stylosanthis]MDV3174111.1 23S rRNA (guanosine(2251)-2'-O)-methyltransferase RlmB [Candidatus Phytoplas
MIVYGKNVIKEVVKNKRQIYEIYVNKKMKDKFFLKFLSQNKIKYQLTDKHNLNEKVQNKEHQGVVAKVQDYEYSNLYSFLKLDKLKKFLILDSIHDPHNLGAILRTMETTDFDGVIISKKNQVFLTGAVAKSASGALEYVNVFLVDDLYQTIIELKKNNILIIGTDSKANLSFDEIEYNNRSFAIVLGNEGLGIRFLLKKNCDFLIKIPMKGKINSLNVSVVAALVMYISQIKY